MGFPDLKSYLDAFIVDTLVTAVSEQTKAKLDECKALAIELRTQIKNGEHALLLEPLYNLRDKLSEINSDLTNSLREQVSNFITKEKHVKLHSPTGIKEFVSPGNLTFQQLSIWASKKFEEWNPGEKCAAVDVIKAGIQNVKPESQLISFNNEIHLYCQTVKDYNGVKVFSSTLQNTRGYLSQDRIFSFATKVSSSPDESKQAAPAQQAASAHQEEKLAQITYQMIEEVLKKTFASLSERIKTLKTGPGEGTTISVCSLFKEQDGGIYVTTAHLGDSPVLLMREGKIYQLTIDHNTKFLEAIHNGNGIIHLDEQKQLNKKRELGSLKKNIGINDKGYVAGKVNLYRSLNERIGTSETPDIRTIILKAGDKIAVATDGITDANMCFTVHNLTQANICDQAQKHYLGRISSDDASLMYATDLEALPMGAIVNLVACDAHTTHVSAEFVQKNLAEIFQQQWRAQLQESSKLNVPPPQPAPIKKQSKLEELYNLVKRFINWYDPKNQSGFASLLEGPASIGEKLDKLGHQALLLSLSFRHDFFYRLKLLANSKDYVDNDEEITSHIQKMPPANFSEPTPNPLQWWELRTYFAAQKIMSWLAYFSSLGSEVPMVIKEMSQWFNGLAMGGQNYQSAFERIGFLAHNYCRTTMQPNGVLVEFCNAVAKFQGLQTRDNQNTVIYHTELEKVIEQTETAFRNSHNPAMCKIIQHKIPDMTEKQKAEAAARLPALRM